MTISDGVKTSCCYMVKHRVSCITLSLKYDLMIDKIISVRNRNEDLLALNSFVAIGSNMIPYFIRVEI